MLLRILFVGMLPPQTGGAALSLSKILIGLADSGNEICAVAPITNADFLEAGDLFAARNPKLRVVRYLLPGHRFEPYKPQLEATASLENRLIGQLVCELVPSFAPDLIVAGHESYGSIVSELARQHGLPWCQWLRGSPTAQILSGDLPEAVAREYVELYRSADGVIAVARYMAVGLQERHGIPGVRWVPNAVDLRTFAPREPSSELRSRLKIGASFKVVFVPASLISRKRPTDVLNAAALVAGQGSEIVFVFAGEGPLADTVQALAKERELTETCRFLGWVPPLDMPDLFALADLVVMASEAEGMSRVYLETLACGRALLASDILAARDLIVDGENGFLFRLGDADHLAERILELLGDDCLRMSVGARARASVADRSLDQIAESYETELRRIAEAGSIDRNRVSLDGSLG
jgi:glycosyltransferase involved in cell wall biosynthesis